MIRIEVSENPYLYRPCYNLNLNEILIAGCTEGCRPEWSIASNLSLATLQHNFDYLFNEIQASKTRMDILEAKNNALETENKFLKEQLEEKLKETNENVKHMNENNDLQMQKTEICNEEMKVLKESLNHVTEIQNVNLDNYNKLLTFTEEMKETIPQLELRMNGLIKND